MPAKLYRCVNPDCGTAPDFEAERPVCPACGADGRVNTALVCEITPVHYLVKAADGPIVTPLGNRRIACCPARARLLKACSGERVAVTCPKCRVSKIFTGDDAADADQHDDFAERKIARECGAKAVVQGA